ncbi:MAG: S41 family peptidase [Bacteroidales bacterium]|nr:S41 family peptidase [Bacteroidales bacterium]
MKKIVFFAAMMLWTAATQAQWNQESVKLMEVMDRVSRYYVDSIDESEVVEDAITNLLHDLDPHSSYISLEELELMNEQLEGEFEGIGVSFNILNDTIFIIRAIAGGPSERLGIRPGDRIVEVDGENVAGIGISTQGVQSRLKGAKGSRVNIKVKRKQVPELLEFNITRDKIPVYSLDASYMVNDRIGYVKLARFSQTTNAEFEKAVRDLRKQGMQDLVLDLSGNGGGWLPVAVELADHFLDGEKMIVSTEGRTVSKREYKSRKEGLFEKGRLVVMIDQNSASASEIVSGAVQDWDRGVIVGRRSFGKGLVQQPFYLNDGSMIRLTVARYYTPTGRLIQKPYENGYEDYEMDLINRYNSGELNSTDSITFPESQRYKTLILKRTVYGGGGIMPDYFVPIDTSNYSVYYRDLINKGIFNQFILQYVDRHRNELKQAYPDFPSFKAGYEPQEALFSELIDFAEGEGIAFNRDQWNISEPQLKMLVRSYLARDLYETGSFYEIYNESDPLYQKAVEILKDPHLHQAKLAKADQ